MNVSHTIIRASVLSLQTVIIFIGIGVAAALLIEPHFEGRNQNASWHEIYLQDPLLAYVYIGSIAFFVALYHGFRFLLHIDKPSISTKLLSFRLQRIRAALLVLLGFISGFALYLVTVQRTIEEDIAGGIAMSLFAFLVTVIGIATSVVLEAMLVSKCSKKEIV